MPDNEQAYRSVVDRAGHGNLLRQAFISYTPARYLRPCDLFHTSDRGQEINRTERDWCLPRSA